MGKTFKKILCTLLVVVMCLTMAPLNGFAKIEWEGFDFPEFDFSEIFTTEAKAATEGYYTYEVSGGKATITDVGTSISGDIAIPSTLGGYPVTSIGDYAFDYCNLTSITIPSCVESIGKFAFGWNYSLTSITISEHSQLTRVAGYAFGGCKALNAVYISDLSAWCNIDFNDREANPLSYGNNLYLNGSLVTCLTIPNDVSSIKQNTFCGCESLTTVTVSDSVTNIGDYAFSSCESLTTITISDSVVNIGNFAFNDCESLMAITIPDSVMSIGGFAFRDCKSLTSITFGKNSQLISIGTDAFVRCTSLTSFYIPDNVTNIGGAIFAGCTSLAEINVNGENSAYCSIDGVLYNKDKTTLICYPANKFGTYFTIPDGITSIGGCAFYDCDNLTFVSIPNSVISIDNSAFENCKSLTSVAIPNSVTSIGTFAFAYCSSLTSVKIPDKVTSIMNWSFAYCSSLTSVIIPTSVTSIKYNAFLSCWRIADVYYKGTQEQWKKIVREGGTEALSATKHYNYDDNSIKLNYEMYSVSNLECPFIYITNYPSGYTKDDIVWTSSNEHVIKMNGDVPEPIHSGKANVIATTKDGKYSATCEVTVKASFVMTSPSNDTESIMEGKTAELYIYLHDFSADNLSVDDAKITIDGENHLKLLSKKVEGDCLKLTVEGLTSGYSIINVESKEYAAANRFQIYVYPESIEFRADKVPVLDEEMKTNFFRSGYTVEAFNYVYNEATDTYTVTMIVYNEIGISPVIVAYSNNGNVYDFAAAKRFVGMPGDFVDFLGTLANGLGQLATGDLFTYRTQTYSEKTEIEVEVPSDGYITISNDKKICDFAAVYNAVALGVEMSFVAIDLVTGLTDEEKAKSKDVTEAFMQRLNDVVPDFNSLIMKIANKMCQKSVDNITVATLAELSEYNFDMVNELCEAAGSTFADILYDVLADILNKTFDKAIQNGIIKSVIRNNILTVENFNTLKKYTEPIFKAGEFIYLAEFILRYFNYSSNTGMTNIQFNPCGENGFLCKDKIRVTSDVITDEVLLHHYVIVDNLPYDAFVRENIYPDFRLDNEHDEKEISIDLNRIIEVHEISLKKNGKDVDSVFRATVEMELPSYMNKNTCSVYRVEKDGTYTKLKTTIQGNNVVFETDHFSQYILTGIRNDVGDTTVCGKHNYTTGVIESTCTVAGSTTYKCFCGYTYTEEDYVLAEHEYVAEIFEEPDCKTDGIRIYRCKCGLFYTESISANGHKDSNGDSVCDECGINQCSHMCHKSGLMGFFWKIIRFFQKLFQVNQYCSCGIMHW